MFIEKGLLIKGAASLGVVGAAVGGYVERERIGNLIFGSGSIEESNSLLNRAGIKCDGENGCVLGENKTLTIRKGEVTKEVNTLSSSTGAKITLERLEGENDYNEGLKFTVKGGNISLGEESPITLENTETYELKEEGSKFILSKKEVTTNEVIPSLLERAGISCNEQSGCVLGEGKTIVIRKGDVSREVNTLSSSTSSGAKIILEKLTGGSDYNEGLKFTVTGGDITLGSESPITLENTETYELKEESGKYIFLRKNASLLERSGISCNSQSGCVLGENKTITIRQDDFSKEVNTISSAGAKITLEKLNRGQRGYNLGLKFSVDGGDITIGATPSQVTMEKSETYELTEENGKFILSRKNKSIYRGELRIPKTCPESDKSSKQVECKIMAAGPKNADSIRVKAKGITPPSEVQGLMNKWGITLPKDLRDLGVETPRTKVRWTLDPTKKNSSLYPKITKEELKVPEHLKVRRST